MPSPRRTIHLAMLNADTSQPNTYPPHGHTLSDMLHASLASASTSTSTRITHTVFDVVHRREYPTTITGAYDAVVVTASAASATAAAPWIRDLRAFVAAVHRAHPRVRLFGSCFGHHVLCQALLGLRVAPMPRGWEVGVHAVRFARPTRPDEGERALLLQFVHADHVVLGDTKGLPAPWTVVGATEHCAVQGVCEPGRVLTLQGHFELDGFHATGEATRVFGAGEQQQQEERRSVAQAGEELRRDAALVAQMVVAFLAGEEEW